MDLSKFVDSITLIPLETNEHSLIKKVVAFHREGDRFYLNDNLEKVLAFKEDGKFLFSTHERCGNGPGEYASCIGFSILKDSALEIFDGLKYKLWTYGVDLAFVSESQLAKEVLPVSNYLRVSDDICILEDTHTLKFYSIKNENVIKTVSVPFKKGLSIISKSGLRFQDGDIYYSPRYPGSTLYKVDVSKLALIPDCTFDFGVHSFDIEDLPDEQPLSFYRHYVLENIDLAFVADKFTTSSFDMSFVVYNGKMYFVIYNKHTHSKEVFFNELGSKGQLMVPDFYSDNKFYYVCEPNILEYILDFGLVSPADIEKIKTIKEDDNPVVVCYKLKL